MGMVADHASDAGSRNRGRNNAHGKIVLPHGEVASRFAGADRRGRASWLYDPAAAWADT